MAHHLHQRILRLVALIALTAGCNSGRPLDLELLQCGMHFGAIRAGGVCELSKASVEPRIVRVAVFHPEPDPDLEIVSGGLFDTAPTQSVSISWTQRGRNGYLTVLPIRVDKDSSAVVLRTLHPFYARRVATIPIAPYEISSELQKGLDLWRDGQRTKVEVELRKATTQGSAASRERAMRQLAKFLVKGAGQQRDKLSEALQLHEEAARLARDSGELSDEAWNLLNQADIRQRYLGQSGLAERIMSSTRLQELRELLPGLSPWSALFEGSTFENSDPYRSLLAVNKGLENAILYKDSFAGEQLCQQRSMLLYTLGRVAEARKPCNGSASFDACSDAYNLLNKAGIGLMEMSLTHDQNADLRSDLRLVLDLLKADCKSDTNLIRAKIYQVHAQLLAQEYDQISDDEMERWPQPQDPELAAELLSLRGELALGRPHPDLAAARVFFERLRQFAEEKKLRAYVWQALTKLAQSYEKDDVPKAEKLYQEAIGLLEQWAEQLPLGLGHGSFLGRHEEGVRHYVDFLVRNKKNRQALAVIRRTRVLGLLALTLTRAVEELPATTHESLLQARIDYEEAQLKNDMAQQERMYSRLLQQLGEIVGEPNIIHLPPPMPAENEALFTCYPIFPENRLDTTEQDWACFAARGAREPVVQRVGAINPEQPHSHLSRQLLKPFVDVLASVSVIRVLEYGRFSQVPMHLLPLRDAAILNSQPLSLLGDQHSVVYALDLPTTVRTAASASPPRHSSLVVINPSKEHPELERCGQQVLDAAQRLGRPIHVLSPQVSMPVLLAHVQEASFLHYAGHAVLEHGSDMYGLSISNSETLSSSSLLHAAQVPTYAVLLGCGTGSTQDEHGDGVALGVAQALLMRGAREVIAATRVVNATTAAEVACQLYRQLSVGSKDKDKDKDKDGPHPFAAALQRALVEPSVKAFGQHEQGAFRSYVY